jgi:hypothetical protein
MELLLIAIILISLGLAAVMSVVAWKLLRDGRERSAARVATLQTLAHTEDSGADDVERVHQYRQEHPAPLPGRVEREDDTFDESIEFDDDDFRFDSSLEQDDMMEVDLAADHPRQVHDDWDLALRPDTEPPARPRRTESRRPARPSRARRPAVPPVVVRMPRRPESVPDDMFASASAEPSRQGWQGLTAALTAAVMLIVGTGVVYAVRSTELLTSATRRMSAASQAPTEPIELLSLKHRSDPTGAFTVTGFVQNPVEGAALADIVAVVYLFDDEGRYYAGGKAAIELSSLEPGDQSPFVVTVRNAGMVNRYRVGFRHRDGGVVAHVDHRRQLLRGGSGDAVNGVDRGGDRPPAGPHRAEG